MPWVGNDFLNIKWKREMTEDKSIKIGLHHRQV